MTGSTASTVFTQTTDFFGGGLQQLAGLLTPDTVIRALILYFFVIWGAFIIWVTKDITNRTNSLFYQFFGILTIIVLTPILGLPIYLLIRPRNTLVEQYYEESGVDASDIEAGKFCPYCQEMIEADFFFCPHCHAELLYDCFQCGKIIQTQWKICPYCGVDQTNEELREKTAFGKKIAAESTPSKKTTPKTEEKKEKTEDPIENAIKETEKTPVDVTHVIAEANE